MKNKKDRKITKAEFECFEKWVKHYADLLGLKRFEIKIKRVPKDSFWALVKCDPEFAKADIELNEIIEPHDKDIKKQFRNTALHECIHILLSQLRYFSDKRFDVNEDDSKAEEEKVVQTLTKTILGLE